jgi:hypothetical protein
MKKVSVTRPAYALILEAIIMPPDPRCGCSALKLNFVSGNIYTNNFGGYAVNGCAGKCLGARDEACLRPGARATRAKVGSERRAIYSPIAWPTAHCFTPENCYSACELLKRVEEGRNRITEITSKFPL